MKKTIKKAFDEQLVHDQKVVLEKILTTPVEKIDDLNMIFNEHTSKSNKYCFRFISSVMVMAGVILIASLNYLGFFNNHNTTIVSLDVNPGFEFIIDDSNKVEKLIALNDDARSLLEDRDYNNWGLEEVVESLIISLCKNNYITLERNSVLILTEDNDDKRSNDINQLVNDVIVKVLNQFEINGNIVLRTTKMDKSLEKTANKYNVSVGKMKLINEIIDKNEYRIEELIDLSITELLTILDKSLEPKPPIKSIPSPVEPGSLQTGDNDDDNDIDDNDDVNDNNDEDDNDNDNDDNDDNDDNNDDNDDKDDD